MSLQQLYDRFDKSPDAVHDPKSETGRTDHDFGSTAKRLQYLSRTMLEAQHNNKDLSQSTMTWEYMSPNIRVWNETLPVACNRDQHVSNLELHHRCQPDYHTQIVSMSSNVDEVHGRATVFLYIIVLGLVCGHRREAIASFHWERKQGRWLCIKHVGFRGPAGFS